ncbi:uncharacterized protein MONOS_601 [Monocercomonoides exilis]|uniref:uncharacterized protein n=1 Tax=Monocercomonoides exilis TaxID=2049356 RepID=UPI00355A36BD|nr:hypothetical protein MONOS_601 [Monocercomonoides exilis]|eukprot:MONOS_601.1-p1 / transcript=MONOS_601.1 / gene=MONOS_601 / organism=Monocercomonoides_exilis_PA203 / gene_product=unspecified product / transcript_product=unspecified product / location=Mono_scaffold00009:236249-236641(+) / protein_length=131 / sequence_SO=supercontig / SO=protein_coding / is_pseudo=false
MEPSMGLWVWWKRVEWIERHERMEKEGIDMALEMEVVVANELCALFVMVVVVVENGLGEYEENGVRVKCGEREEMLEKSVLERWRLRRIWGWREEEGEKRKGWWRGTKEEKEEWEMKKEAGIVEWEEEKR